MSSERTNRRVEEMKQVFAIWRVCALALVLLSGLRISALSPAYAQEKAVDWRRIDVDITVNRDGTFDVVEVLEIEFMGGPFTFGFRDIPGDYLARIDTVRVRDAAGEYRDLGEPTRQGPPGTFFVTQSGGDYTIRWFFPPTTNQTRVFRISYRVYGGLRYYDEGDQLWWEAVFPDRSGPVRESTVTVTVPARVTHYDAYFVPAEMEVVNETTVRFRAQTQVPPGKAFEVRVQWPHGVVAGSPQPWQARADEEARRLEAQAAWDQTWRPVVNLALLALALLILSLGSAGVYLLWYTRGRDKPTDVHAEYLPDPPSDLAPALVGTLLDESADLQDIVATLLDLGRQGVLEIEERPRSRGGTDFLFRRTEKSPRDLRPFEREILKAVLGSRAERRLSDLKNRFYEHIPRLQETIYTAAVEEELFPSSPAAVRRQYGLAGVALLVLGGLGTFLLAGILANRADLAVCPPVSLGIVGVLLAIASRFMPRKTERGAQEAAKWRAFRRYLRHLDRYADVKRAADILDRYLPYAVAMGVEREFLHKFQKIAPEEEVRYPPWYRPVWMGPVWDTGSHPYSRGTGGRSVGPAREMAGGGRKVPRLDDMSRGMGRGLADLSRSLGTMLAITSTTMASRPQSSGSSFGGGGWSGGGSFGGGGGGGGSGGFG